MSLNRKPSAMIKVVIANKNGAYTSGQQIGVPVELKNAVDSSGGNGTLISVAVLDPAKQDKALDILLFSQQPTTPGTDAAAVSVSAADLANLLAVVNVPTTAYADLGTPSVGTVANIQVKLRSTKAAAQSNSSIWALVVSRGTPNYAAINALNILFGIDQD